MKIINSKKLEVLKRKAEKWDALRKKIDKYYPYDEATGEDLESDGDLGDIGLEAAMAFGYL